MLIVPPATASWAVRFNSSLFNSAIYSLIDEVLSILREKGLSINGYIAGLNNEELDRTAQLAVAGGTISTQQFIENIIILSGGEHLSNMKAAI